MQRHECPRHVVVAVTGHVLRERPHGPTRQAVVAHRERAVVVAVGRGERAFHERRRGVEVARQRLLQRIAQVMAARLQLQRIQPVLRQRLETPAIEIGARALKVLPHRLHEAGVEEVLEGLRQVTVRREVA